MRTERKIAAAAAAAAAFLLLATAGCGVDDDAPVLGRLPPTVTITEVHVHGSTSPTPSASDPAVNFGVPTTDPAVTLVSPNLSDNFEIEFVRGTGGTQSAILQDTSSGQNLINITVSDQ